MIRIDDVIKYLQSIRFKYGNLQVCRVGHLGEINDMDTFDIYVRLAHDRKNINKTHEVVHVDVPDIGPDPD